MSYDDAPTLVAIDPVGCGCTECLIGEYKPLDRATDEDIQRLLIGELRDNTSEFWLISEKTMSFENGGFDVFAGGHSFEVDRVALPIELDSYNIQLSKDTFEQVSSGLPDHIGKDY